MELIIRRAVLKDAPAMAALDKKCFSQPWSKQAFEEEFGKNSVAIYFIGLIDDEIVGYAGQWEVLDEGHITNVAVHPDYRRKGAGEKILKELICDSLARGINRHTLEVRMSNAAAIGLYHKFGFKIGGIRKEYYSDNLEDALILWRE